MRTRGRDGRQKQWTLRPHVQSERPPNVNGDGLNAREIIPAALHGQVSENERVLSDYSVSKHRLLLY
jgi:hypothetical protein